MLPKHAIQRLERLRELRARRFRDADAAPLFAAEASRLARQRRTHGGAGDAWAAVCPPHLLDKTRVLGLRRGALTIGVADAPTRFELRNHLAAGAQRDLVRLAPTTIRRVKLVPDPGRTTPPSPR